jgi:hypothetical protein
MGIPTPPGAGASAAQAAGTAPATSSSAARRENNRFNMSVLLFGVNCLFSLLVMKDSNQALWQFMEELLLSQIAKFL